MAINCLILMGAVLFSSGSVALGTEAGPTVVSVHYSVRENDPAKLEKLVAIPVEQSLQRLDGVARISSSTSHGVVDVEVRFQGDATIQDLKAVRAHIELLQLGEDVAVLSRDIALRPAVFQ